MNSFQKEYSLLICFKLGAFDESYLDQILSDCSDYELWVTFDKGNILKILPEKADLIKSYFKVVLATANSRDAVYSCKQRLYKTIPSAELFFLERE